MTNISALGIPVVLLLLSFISLTSARGSENQTCQTPDKQPGLCLPLENCTILYKLYKKKEPSNIEIEVLQKSQCGLRRGKTLVCCAETQIKKRMLIGELPKPDKCGRTHSNRIFGGTKTDMNEFPWMALLMYTNGSDEQQFGCGGSLINERYVLTAAHCVTQLPPGLAVTAVRLGEWDITTNPDCETDINNNKNCAASHVDVPVEKIIVHDNHVHSIRKSHDDIALMRLSRSVEYTNYISPICLPLSDRLEGSDFGGNTMIISGWGHTKNSNSRSDIKQKAVIDVVPLSECQSYYLKSIPMFNTQMCVGDKEGINACKGDSGGPLIGLDTKNGKVHYHFIAGIMSFGSNLCEAESFSVLTKVSSYVDWIQKNLDP